MFWKLLDLFFVIFHSSLILFNLFGWMGRKTRRANLVTLGLTAVSWFGLGIFYGIGYCPLTEWHWRVLQRLGRGDLPDSYTKYLVDRLTGWDANAGLVDTATAVLFFLALGCSVYVNFRRGKR